MAYIVYLAIPDGSPFGIRAVKAPFAVMRGEPS